MNSRNFCIGPVALGAAVCIIKSCGFFPALQMNNGNNFANIWQKVENAGLYTADMNLQTLPDLYIFSFIEVIQALAKNE